MLWHILATDVQVDTCCGRDSRRNELIMSVRSQSATDSQYRPKRPPSARPSTAAGDSTGSHVIAVYEHRGNASLSRRARETSSSSDISIGIGREIGIATLNRNTGQVSLLQVSITIELNDETYFSQSTDA